MASGSVAPRKQICSTCSRQGTVYLYEASTKGETGRRIGLAPPGTRSVRTLSPPPVDLLFDADSCRTPCTDGRVRGLCRSLVLYLKVLFHRNLASGSRPSLRAIITHMSINTYARRRYRRGSLFIPRSGGRRRQDRAGYNDTGTMEAGHCTDGLCHGGRDQESRGEIGAPLPQGCKNTRGRRNEPFPRDTKTARYR